MLKARGPKWKSWGSRSRKQTKKEAQLYKLGSIKVGMAVRTWGASFKIDTFSTPLLPGGGESSDMQLRKML